MNTNLYEVVLEKLCQDSRSARTILAAIEVSTVLYGGLLGYNIVSAGIFDSPVLFICLFQHHFYFPAYLLGGFTFGDLLGRPWSRVSSLIPPATCLSVLSRIGFRIPLLVEIHRMELTHALARSATVIIFFNPRKSPYNKHALGET